MKLGAWGPGSGLEGGVAVGAAAYHLGEGAGDGQGSGGAGAGVQAVFFMAPPCPQPEGAGEAEGRGGRRELRACASTEHRELPRLGGSSCRGLLPHFPNQQEGPSGNLVLCTSWAQGRWAGRPPNPTGQEWKCQVQLKHQGLWMDPRGRLGWREPQT